MRKMWVLGFICCVLGLLAFTIPQTKHDTLVDPTLQYIKLQCRVFSASTEKLKIAISHLDDKNPGTIYRAKLALKQSRLCYKNIEFFLFYFLRSATWVYNEPNKHEVEEPFMEAREPTGLQVIEAMLYDEHPVSNKAELIEQADLISFSAKDLGSLLFNIKIDDQQILESIRLELIRIITLGITGFDAPELKTGIVESQQALLSIQKNLFPLLLRGSKEADSVRIYLEKSIQLLTHHPDFNSFDRLKFLTRAALPLQYHYGIWIKQLGLSVNTSTSLNYDVKNIFSKGAIQLPFGTSNRELADLGRRLFFEKDLSQLSNRSCATCHQPEKYFTDGVDKNISLDGLSTLQRNTPSLFYATYQYAQFWDGRSNSLENQLQAVLENPKEMGSDHHIIIQRLRARSDMNEAFKRIFADEKDTAINLHNISLSISAFLLTLAPMNSAFDLYIAGSEKSLNADQVKGFNLFMGKAQCATCHYAPLFNGLVAPLYNRTELEVLGTTNNTQFDAARLDDDSGRYSSYPIPYYQYAFKTPSLRNVAKTAPYMHNGAFETLETVLEFYNKGGANGLGLHLSSQTLSSKPLNLDKNEMKCIISFLYALTDRPVK